MLLIANVGFSQYLPFQGSTQERFTSVGIGALGDVYPFSIDCNLLHNSAFGYQSLASTTIVGSPTDCYDLAYPDFNYTPFYNSGFGAFSLANNISGGGNSAFGKSALGGNKHGDNNVAIGLEALRDNILGGRNTAVGARVLHTSQGFDNVAIGYKAGEWLNGNDNIAIGISALSGSANVDRNLGTRNISIGKESSFSTRTSFDNIVIGNQALYLSTSSYAVVAIGGGSQHDNISGKNCVSVGYKSLYKNLNHNNVAIGRQSLFNCNRGNSNTAIGTYSGLSVIAFNNTTSLGYAASATSSNSVQIGNASITSINGYVNFTNISDRRVKSNIKEDVPGLEFITLLKPVTYNLNLDAIAKINNTPDSLRLRDAEQLKANELQCGFIAQDVETAANNIGFDFHGVDKSQNENDLFGLRYAEFVVPLVKSVQELNEQNIELTKTNQDLVQKLLDIEERLNQIEEKNNSGSTDINQDLDQKAELYQNVPNPFYENTVIKYYLPKSITSGEIIITNLAGKVVGNYPLRNAGHGQVSIDSGKLEKGEYIYTLYTDDMGIIDSKKLVVM